MKTQKGVLFMKHRVHVKAIISNFILCGTAAVAY